MELLTGNDFDELFRTFKRSAFHLEMRDEYHVANEVDPFRRWLNGEPDDYEWFQGWLDLMRSATDAGKTVQRARVMTEPITDYVRFEHALAPFNVAAGEEVFWVPRDRTAGIDFPEHDYWLFDESIVSFNIFSADGDSFGARLSGDPVDVAQCLKVRDQVLAVGIPHREYVPH
ncbi:MAG: hypothetical protein L0Y54_15795 [Sporichthyaceae bacterium]|nr:hypothetical protein [Sporichthyaceae bacterium]